MSHRFPTARSGRREERGPGVVVPLRPERNQVTSDSTTGSPGGAPTRGRTRYTKTWISWRRTTSRFGFPSEWTRIPFDLSNAGLGSPVKPRGFFALVVRILMRRK